MRHLWHLVRKDLDRVKWAAVGLVLLVAARPLLGLRALSQSSLSEDDALLHERIDLGLVLAHAVGAWLLTLWIAQLDSPRRRDAFLHTRPVKRGTLCLAKVLGPWLVGACAPTLVLLPWWIGCGVDGVELASVAACHGVLWTVSIVCAALVGSLADSFHRAALWSVAFIGVAACIPVLLSPAVHGMTTWLEVDVSRSLARLVIIWLGLGVLGIACALPLAYLRRPGLRAFGGYALAAGVLLAAGVVAKRGFQATPAAETLPSPAEATAPDAALFGDLKIEPTALRRVRVDKTNLNPNVAYLKLALSGLVGHVALIRCETSELAPHGKTPFSTGSGVSAANEQFKRMTRTGPRQEADKSARENVFQYLDSPRIDSLDPDGLCDYRAAYSVHLYRPEKVADAPIAPTGWHRQAGFGYRLSEVQAINEGVVVRINRTHLQPDGIWGVWLGYEFFYGSLGNCGANGNRGLLTLHDAGTSRNISQLSTRKTYTVAGVSVEQSAWLIRPPMAKDDKGNNYYLAPTPAWREGLGYTAFEFTPVGTVRRTVEARGLKVENGQRR